MTLTIVFPPQAAMVQQEGSAAGPYRFIITARLPNNTDTRTPAELRSPQLMNCVAQVLPA